MGNEFSVDDEPRQDGGPSPADGAAEEPSPEEEPSPAATTVPPPASTEHETGSGGVKRKDEQGNGAPQPLPKALKANEPSGTTGASIPWGAGRPAAPAAPGAPMMLPAMVPLAPARMELQPPRPIEQMLGLFVSPPADVAPPPRGCGGGATSMIPASSASEGQSPTARALFAANNTSPTNSAVSESSTGTATTSPSSGTRAGSPGGINAQVGPSPPAPAPCAEVVTGSAQIPSGNNVRRLNVLHNTTQDHQDAIYHIRDMNLLRRIRRGTVVMVCQRRLLCLLIATATGFGAIGEVQVRLHFSGEYVWVRPNELWLPEDLDLIPQGDRGGWQPPGPPPDKAKR